MNGARNIAVRTLVIFGLLAAIASADSARKLVGEGNAAYAKGKLDEALAAYDKASVEMPESPRILFNKGTVRYKQADYAKAIEAFEAAALKTKDLAFEARCAFNLGNCAFREAERQKDGDLKKAIGGYQKAIRHYQEALKLDPKLKDAAHNVEVTRLLMKDLLDKLKKQQEKAKQQQKKQQEMLKKLKELVERQQKANEQNTKLADQKPTQPAPDALKKDADELARQQNAIRDDTKKLSGEMAKAQPKPQPNQPPPPTQKARQHLDRAATEQAVAGERIGKQQLQQAKPPQAEALDQLKKALAALAGQQQPKGGQNQKQKQQPKPQKQQKQAAKPRDEKARDILKEEKKNRDQRRRRMPAGYQQVDKDW